MLKNLFLSLLLLVANPFTALSNNFLGSKERTILRSEPQPIVYNDLTSDDLKVTVTQNNSTESTQFYTFSFSTADYVYYSTRYTNCRIIVTDPTFTNERISHELDGNYPEYTAALYSISGSKTNGEVVIPNTTIYSVYFKFKITEICSNCIVNNADKITNIIIPDSVETIASDAFAGIDASTNISCVSSSAKAGWESGWNQGKTPTYSVSYTTEQRRQAVNVSYSSYDQVNNGNIFVLGYYGENDLNEPLKIQYDVKLSGGSTVTRNSIIELQSVNNPYNGVGNPIGEETVKLSVSLDIAEGESIDDDSLYIQNIYKFTGDYSTPLDKVTGAYQTKVANASVRHSLDEFIKVSPLRVVTFGGYTELDVDIETVDGIYEVLKPTIANEYKQQMNNGVCHVRYRFTSIVSSYYEITYKDSKGNIKTVEAVIDSPYNFYNLEKNGHNTVGYLFKNSEVASDFDGKNLIKVELLNFYVSLDLFSSKTKDIVSAQASVDSRFGKTCLYDANIEAKPFYNLNNILVLILIVSISTYLLVAVILFVVFKNVFKNDEFRRLKPKQFIKKGLIYFLGYMLIVMSATFIVFRWGAMHTTVITFNPLDAFVIGFTVAGLIALGLFIKTLVVAIKTSRKRRETKKLKLNELKADDGTN